MIVRGRTVPGRVRRLLAGVRLVAFDFDGVFTDNRVWVFDDGREAVCCSRADGLGLRKIEALGVAPVIISTEPNPVVLTRATKLKVPCVHGCDDKLAALQALCQARGLSLDETAFVGNDLNDLKCLSAVRVPIVVGDAHPDVTGVAVYRTRTAGGRGAVREVCDLIEAARRSPARRVVSRRPRP